MKLCVLHLSDIHFKTGTESVLEIAEKIASASFTAARNTNACLIAVTGDISFSGQVKEFEFAATFLKRIETEIARETGKPTYLILVPGNHDCTLKPADEIRELLIQQITNNPSLIEKEGFIDKCVTAQINYFKFREDVTTLKPIFDSPLWTEYELEIQSKTIRISALNAAWMSRIKEAQGSLVFPISNFERQMSASADLRLALLHQPYHWNQQRSYQELRGQLRRSAYAVLSGHEHISNAGKVDDELTGSSLYFEASALNPEENEGNPGFAIYQFDLSDSQVSVQRYGIKPGHVEELQEALILELASRSEKDHSAIEFTEEWRADLDNPGGYFIHSEKNNILLDDIFIYPDLKDWEKEAPGRAKTISSESLIKNLQNGNKCLILGEEKAGKTTLLHVYVKQLFRAGFLPVYVRASDINNIRKKEDTESRINRYIEKQYVNSDAVKSLPKKNRILLVDDIERFKSGIANLPAFIEFAEANFGGIILTANKSFEVSALASKSANESLRTYPRFEILRFGRKLTHKLTKKWCSLGGVTTLAELDQKVDHSENIVNSVIGKNLVPQLPIYLLILLQSCDQHQQGEIQNSGFSHYYQFLITKSLGQVGVKPQELDEHYNYLSHLSWFMQSQEVREIEHVELRRFNSEFSSKFTSVDLTSRLNLLVEARILSRRGQCYSFAYPYVFYFFIGKFLSQKIYSDEEIQNWVIDACSKLYVRDKANAILFLTHHDSNPWVIKKIAEVMKACFHDKKPVEFNGDTLAINQLVQTASQLILAPQSVEKNQEESRELKDALDEENADEVDACPDENGELAFLAKFTLLLKTAEILGQILKNYYGSLEKPLKAELLREVFDGPLRALRIQLEAIAEDMDGFVSHIEGVAFDDDDKGLTPEARGKLARKVAFNVLNSLGTGVVCASAYFVASDKLREDVVALVQSNRTVAYRLIDIGTRLVRPGHIPVDEIDKLAKELRDNHYAFGILQSLGVNRLYLFHSEPSEKHKLCNSLKITMNTVKVIEMQGRDTKLPGA